MSPIRSLSVVGGTNILTVVTTEPWREGFDAIVVSVGRRGVGSLGTALLQQFLSLEFKQADLHAVTPRHAVVLDIAEAVAEHGDPLTKPLRWLILATVRDEPTGGALDGPGTFESARLAFGSAIAAARTAGARRLGLSLLGAGAFGMETSEIVGLMCAELAEALEGRESEPFESVTIFAADRKTIDLVEQTWLRRGQETHVDAELSGGFSVDHVEQDSRIRLSDDDMNLGAYVTMLASLIANSATPLPLSVGLFGEWGSGKSFLMGLLRNRIDELKGSKSDAYCAEIEQITFNAWHYADTNLWASLASTIFGHLAGGEDEPSVQRRARLRKELTALIEKEGTLAAAVEQATAETQRLQAEILGAEHEADISAKILILEIAKTDIGNRLDLAWKRLGITDALEQRRLVIDSMRGVGDETKVLRSALRGRRGAVIAVGAVVALLLLGASAVLPASGVALSRAALATASTALAAAAAFLGAARSGLRVLNESIGQARAEVLRQPDEPLARLYMTLEQAKARQEVLAQLRVEAIARVNEVQREIAELDPALRWRGFVSDRAASDDYRGRLGLVSTLRRDFEQLNRLMSEWRSAPKAAGMPRAIDRIVLYIDDLDRCTTRQVVDVLQAVHLLLAFDLFVVVVGVDPRWLLQSLRHEFQGNIRTTADSTTTDEMPDWTADPLVYLEKIFNVPFALPGMTTEAFARVIRRVTAVERTVGPALPRIDETAAGAEPVGDNQDRSALASDEEQVFARAGARGMPVESHSEIARVQAGLAPLRRDMTEREFDLLGALAPLIDSPRAGKRLLNLYRLLRSTRDLADSATFLGGPEAEFQAVVVLLGVLTAAPRLLGQLLWAPASQFGEGGICRRMRRTTWMQMLDELHPQQSPTGWHNCTGALRDDEAREWTQLLVRMSKANDLVGNHLDLEKFQRWGPRVARFSFVLSPFGFAAPAL